MQSRTQNWTQLRTLRSYYPGGSSLTFFPNTTLGSDNLDVLNQGTTNGNFRDPNSFAWQRSYGPSVFRGRWGYTYTGGQSGEDWSGPSPWSLNYGSTPVVSNQIRDEALSKMLEGLRGQTDLMVDLATAYETARMLDSVKNLVKYIRSFHPKKWASKWLEYQYGWRPLVSTIYGAVDNLHSAGASGMYTLRARVSRRETDSRSLPCPWANDRTYFRNLEDNLRVEVGAKFVIAPTVYSKLGDWSSLNPVTLAWELLPYSFVVDWVYDIGGYLRNLENAMLFSPSCVGGYVTRSYRRRSWADVNMTFTRPGYGYAEHYILTASRVMTGMSREPFASLPFPDLPRVNPELGWQRVISAAALMSNHLGRR